MIKQIIQKSRLLASQQSSKSIISRSYCTYYNTKDNQLPYDTSPLKRHNERENHVERYLDTYNKHQTLVPLYEKNSVATPTVFGLYPRAPLGTFVAPSATVIGNVNLCYGSSIWYSCVVKADVNYIHIGSFTNIQDGTIIRESTRPLSLDHDGSTIIGHYTTVGHNCVLEACTIEENCLIGMGSTLESGSYVETNSILGAHSVLPKGARVPSGELWAGRPAKFIRKLTDEEIVDIHNQAAHYFQNAMDHNQDLGLHNPSSVHVDAERQGVQVGFAGISWVLIYRTETYKRSKATVDRLQAQLDKVKEEEASQSQILAKAKGKDKRVEKLEEQLKTANKDMSVGKMKSMFAVAISMISLFSYLNSVFDGKIVAKLPFEPIGFIQGISHRNLPGKDFTDCSMTFIYVICSMCVRTNLQKILGTTPPKAQNANPFGIDTSAKQ
eukprot:gene1160-1329_t